VAIEDLRSDSSDNWICIAFSHIQPGLNRIARCGLTHVFHTNYPFSKHRKLFGKKVTWLFFPGMILRNIISDLGTILMTIT